MFVSINLRRFAAVIACLAIAILGLETVSQSAEAAVHVVGHGSMRQAYATGLPAHTKVRLRNKAGHVIATKRADAQGGVLFRNLRPGPGYRMQVGSSRSAAFTVHTAAAKPWHTDFYDQKIDSNSYGYLTTRDGTKLAISVHPPSNAAGLGIGVALPNFAPPYPTLIEYAGYGYADPKDPQNGIATLANLMGFAVVDVNMRGTGCSGGAYDFFERNQQLDAYDVIETIAHQPWVKGHKVGMMGISYGAISQLFSAALNPPDLSAIAPLSTIDSVATTLYPGGILNNGFAVAWAKERIHDALPASATGGQAYAWKRVQDGDAVCKSNQDLHGEAINLMKKIRANNHYKPKTADPLDPITFVNKIHVPVFLACQWTDEQTGGHCPALVKHFTGTKKKWFTFTNGAHVDSLDPATFNRWYDFLSLYVAHQAPSTNSIFLKLTAPLIYQTAMGLPGTDLTTLPSDPVQSGNYAAALKKFEALPRVRVLFDSGAGKGAGEPFPGYEKSFSSLPVPGTRATSFYLGKHGAMGGRPTSGSMDRYHSSPKAVPADDFDAAPMAGGLWGNPTQWKWNWKNNPSGTAVSYVSQPLTKDLTVVGGGAVQVWVRSTARDVDLQATISEVRPDGNEVFVQNGWQRASERKLSNDPHNIFRQASTLLEPVPSLKLKDARPLPRGKFVKVTIPLYYEGHAYRAGSRIRLTISGVNGTQPVWSFKETKPAKGRPLVEIAHSPKLRSRLVLPVIPGATIPTKLPACGSLRNEPCRPYVAMSNHPARLPKNAR